MGPVPNEKSTICITPFNSYPNNPKPSINSEKRLPLFGKESVSLASVPVYSTNFYWFYWARYLSNRPETDARETVKKTDLASLRKFSYSALKMPKFTKKYIWDGEVESTPECIWVAWIMCSCTYMKIKRNWSKELCVIFSTLYSSHPFHILFTLMAI